MRKLMSWIILGIGMAMVMGSVLISRTNTSTAALPKGDYEIVPIKWDSKWAAFLLDKNGGTTWYFRTDPKTKDMYWFKLKAK